MVSLLKCVYFVVQTYFKMHQRECKQKLSLHTRIYIQSRWKSNVKTMNTGTIKSRRTIFAFRRMHPNVCLHMHKLLSNGMKNRLANKTQEKNYKIKASHSKNTNTVNVSPVTLLITSKMQFSFNQIGNQSWPRLESANNGSISQRAVHVKCTNVFTFC